MRDGGAAVAQIVIFNNFFFKKKNLKLVGQKKEKRNQNLIRLTEYLYEREQSISSSSMSIGKCVFCNICSCVSIDCKYI